MNELIFFKDELLTNMGNEEFPWIIEAEIFSSDNPSARIVNQNEAQLNDTGLVIFEKMGISEIASNIKIRYRLKPPKNFNFNYTPPYLNSSIYIASSQAEFSCHLDQINLVVEKDKKFNLSATIVDKNSFLPIKNLNFRNLTWEASIEILQSDRCQPKGILEKILDNSTVYFKTSQIYFLNLSINQTGMYRFNISVRTVNNEYAFSCLTRTVIVSQEEMVLDNTTIPSSYFTFGGKFQDYKKMVEEIRSIMYNCYIERFSLRLKTPISVYEGSVMVNFDYSGSPERLTEFGENITQGLEILRGLQLISTTLNDRKIQVRATPEETNVSTSSNDDSTITGKSTSSDDDSTITGKSTSSDDDSTITGKYTSSDDDSTITGKYTSSDDDSTITGKYTSSDDDSTITGKSTSSDDDSTITGKSTSSDDDSTITGKSTSSDDDSTITGKYTSPVLTTNTTNFANLLNSTYKSTLFILFLNLVYFIY